MNEFNFNPFPVLQTERLVLRQIIMDDLNDLLTIRQNEEVGKYIDRPRSKTVEEATAFIERITKLIANNESVLWGLTKADSNRIIGTACLWNFNETKDKGEIGYELLPEYWGKGYISEVVAKLVDFGFNTLKLASITAVTHPENIASVKLLLKNGFVYEGAEGGFSVYLLTKGISLRTH